MKTLRQLLNRAMEVDLKKNSIVPTKKVRRGEKVLGELPNDLKRLWVLHQQLRAEVKPMCVAINELAKRMNNPENPGYKLNAGDEKLTIDHALAHARSSMVGVTFLMDLGDAFNVTSSDVILEIRENWQVVSFLPDLAHAYRAADTLEELFRRLTEDPIVD